MTTVRSVPDLMLSFNNWASIASDSDKRKLFFAKTVFNFTFGHESSRAMIYSSDA